MGKVLKYLLLALGGIVVLVVAAVIVLFATFDPNKHKATLAAAVLDRTGRTLAIDGELGLVLFPSIGIDLGKTSLSERNGSRPFARLDGARMSLALIPLFSRQVVVDRIVVSGLAVDLVKHRDGSTNFDDLLAAPGRGKPAKPAKRDAGGDAMQLDIAGIDVRSSTISWRDESSASEVKLSVDELRTGRIASGVPGDLAASIKVERTQPPGSYGLKAAAEYRLDLEKKRVALKNLDLKLIGQGAGAQELALRGTLEVDLAPQAFRFDLVSDRLDLDAWLGTTKENKPAKRDESRAAADAAPVDLSGLKGLDLKGTLRVEQFAASGLKARNVHVGLQAAGGRLNINPLEAELYEGRLAGSASADANASRLTLKSELAGVALGPLLHDALDRDLLEGKGRVALDLSTTGSTVGALKKALAGSASFHLQDAALRGVNLTDMVSKVRSLGRAKAGEEQAAAGGERTDFTELSASFVVRDGIAHNEDLSGKSPLLRLSGSGNIDVAAGTLDYLVRPTLVKTSTGQGGQDNPDLRGVTVPVKATGPLDAPRFRVDLSEAKQEVKQKAEEKLKEKAEEKIRERLQDKLKGLLRR